MCISSFTQKNPNIASLNLEWIQLYSEKEFRRQGAPVWTSWLNMWISHSFVLLCPLCSRYLCNLPSNLIIPPLHLLLSFVIRIKYIVSFLLGAKCMTLPVAQRKHNPNYSPKDPSSLCFPQCWNLFRAW